MLQAVSEVIDDYSGLSAAVLNYCLVVKRVLDGAKKPGFNADSWSPLSALVHTANFVRVGNFKEVMDWDAYVSFLTDWARAAEWECSFKRITEVGRVVFLELEERSAVGDYKTVVNSVSVYEFNDDGKISRIDVYLQMEPPGAEMMQSYEGVEFPG